jgi:hypothetical protein
MHTHSPFARKLSNMIPATAPIIPPFTPSHASSAATETIRLHVYRGATWKIVYVETNGAGTFTFWDEEPGDVRRFRFTPSSLQREILVAAATHALDKPRELVYLDFDVPPGSLRKADTMNIGGFREFIRRAYPVNIGIDLDRRILAFLRDKGWGRARANGSCHKRT